MTLPTNRAAAAVSAATNAGQGGATHAGRLTRAAARPARIRPLRLGGAGGPARPSGTKG